MEEAMKLPRVIYFSFLLVFVLLGISGLFFESFIMLVLGGLGVVLFPYFFTVRKVS